MMLQDIPSVSSPTRVPRLVVALAACVLAVSATGPPARAFPDAHIDKRWPSDEMEMNINTDDFPETSDFFYAILESIYDWESVPGSDFNIISGTTTTDPDVDASDGENVIGWADLGSRIVLGRSQGWYSGSDWVESDIVLNSNAACDWEADAASADATCSNGYSNYNLAGVVRHELGHSVGLRGHEEREPRVALMNPAYEVGSMWDRWMHGDDRNGIRTLYPWSVSETDVQLTGWKRTATDTEPVDAPSPTSLRPGEDLTIEFTFENLGTEDVENILVRFYLSTNDFISDFDYHIGSFWASAPGAVDGNDNVPIGTFTRTFEIPEVDEGFYYVGAIADPYDDLAESRENNNTVVFPYDHEPVTIYVDCATISIPLEHLLSPPNGSPCEELSVNFQWWPAEGAEAYELQIGTSCGSGTVYHPIGASHVVHGLVPGESYYWRIRARNYCAWGDWSPCSEFRVRPDLSTPVLVDPENGAECQPSAGVFVDWQPVPDATGYQVQWGTTCGIGPGFETADSWATLVGGEQGETYYWRVRAEYFCELYWQYWYGDWTGCRWFTVQDAPSIASVSPDDGTPGSTVISIFGTHFQSDPGADHDYYITFGGGAVCYPEDPLIQQWHDDQIIVTVPEAAGTGPITVTTPCGTSNEFFWEDTPVDLAIISAEVGLDQVVVEWYGTAGPGGGFDIYRSSDGAAGEYTLIETVYDEGDATHTYTDSDIEPGRTYCYRVALMGQGLEAAVGPICAETPARIPERFALVAAAPNPFNPSTTILFDVPEGAGCVRMTVHDVSGRKVVDLCDRAWAPGRCSVYWDGRTLSGETAASGVYTCRMEADGFEDRIKITLLR